MPNIGTVLREEITRLSRKVSRAQVDPTRKAVVQHRRALAELKRHVAQLTRQLAVLSRKTPAAPLATTSGATAKPVRFAAKGLRAQRNRLGLSATDFGTLVGVSAQSIYKWEHELARPRAELLARLAALRGIGKRQAGQRLAQLSSGKKASRRKT